MQPSSSHSDSLVCRVIDPLYEARLALFSDRELSVLRRQLDKPFAPDPAAPAAEVAAWRLLGMEVLAELRIREGGDR